MKKRGRDKGTGGWWEEGAGRIVLGFLPGPRIETSSLREHSLLHPSRENNLRTRGGSR